MAVVIYSGFGFLPCNWKMLFLQHHALKYEYSKNFQFEEYFIYFNVWVLGTDQEFE